MRLISSFLAALLSLTVLAACGTKTPLSMPPQAPAATAAPPAPTAAADNSNKASTEPRR